MLAETVFTVDLALLTFGLATVIPILVGLLTKLDAPPAVRGVVNLVLAAVAGMVATAIDGGGAFTSEALLAAGEALVVSVAAYYGVLKPVGVTGAVNQATARFGIG